MPCVAYRSTYGSPYAAPRRPARWPWVFATILLVAVISASALLVGDQLRPDEDAALVAQQAGIVGSPPPATETPEPTATSTPAPTPTAVAAGNPTRIAENWVAYWQTGDYTSMYQMTSQRTREAITEEQFVARYTDIEREAGLTKIAAKVTGDAGLDGSVPIEVTLTSSLVGELTEKNAIHLARDGESWLVEWAPSLIFRQLGDTGCIDFMGEITDRGRILDRNGTVLAEDAEVARISVVPGDVADPETTYAELSRIIDMPVDEIQARVDTAGAPNWSIPLKDMPAAQSTELLNQLQPFSGVQVTRATSRSYPYKALTAHLTGWVSVATQEDVERDETGLVQGGQMIGRAGLELGANNLLTGVPGGQLVVVECETRATREVIAEAAGVPPKDIILTVDVEFQKQVDAALAADTKNKRSAAVVIDPRTGAVLAMVSRPSFDPNGFITGNFSEEDIKVMEDDLLRAQANRATLEAYPTGSIFKVITTSAAMKDLGWTGDTPVDCPASFSIGEQTWNDWVVENGLSAQGMLNLHTGLVNSCNTVFYQIGAELDKQDSNYLPDMAKAFGLGKATGIPYFPEVSGTIPDPKWKSEVVGDGWATGDAVNLSIGQGYMHATPLQMANAYAAIANGGTLLQPYVVDRTHVVGGSGTEQVGERVEIGKLGLNEAQIKELQSALRDQTSNPNGVGSSKVFGDFGWPISGKTGTAQNQLDGTDKPHSWFAAYGPADGDATIASVVLIENAGEGVSYAAPVTKVIYDAYIKSNLSKVEP
jgi:penicillin-binding protein 2